jgi:hypothetical protein
VGRLSLQVKPHREATSPRIILGVGHLSAKNAREPERTSGREEEGPGNPTDLYELTFSSLGSNDHVNLLMDVKVISS